MCRTRSLRVIKRLRLKSIRRVKLRLPTGKSKKRERARERRTPLGEEYILKTEESIEEYNQRIEDRAEQISRANLFFLCGKSRPLSPLSKH